MSKAPWAKDDLDGMVEAFSRVIEDHHDRSNPFHDPINADAMTALRFLRGYLPYMKAALAEPEQSEPVLYYSAKSNDLIERRHHDGAANKVICTTTRTAEFSEPLFAHPPRRESDEPVAYVGGERRGWTYLQGHGKLQVGTPLYVAPAQPDERDTVLKQALEALEAMQFYAAAEGKGLLICDEAIEAIAKLTA